MKNSQTLKPEVDLPVVSPKKSTALRLPPELFSEIMTFLHIKEYVSLMAVSRMFQPMVTQSIGAQLFECGDSEFYQHPLIKTFHPRINDLDYRGLTIPVRHRGSNFVERRSRNLVEEWYWFIARFNHFQKSSGFSDVDRIKFIGSHYLDFMVSQFHLLSKRVQLPRDMRADEQLGLVVDILNEAPCSLSKNQHVLLYFLKQLSDLVDGGFWILRGHEQLKRDKGFLVEALKMSGPGLMSNLSKFMDPELTQDKPFIVDALQKITHPRAKYYFFRTLPENIQSDSDISALAPACEQGKAKDDKQSITSTL